MIGKQNYLLVLSGLVMLTSSAHAYDEKYKRVDARMGEYVYLEDTGAKAGEEIKTGGVPSGQALTNPNDKDEVKKKKMVIMGYPGNYALGYHIFFDLGIDTFFIRPKSIYKLTGLGSNPNPSTNVGGDIMFEGNPPIHFLNSPWQKIGAGGVTQRTSTVQVVSLQEGMNFFAVKLDPFDKIYEYEQPAPKNGKSQPVSRLEGNNDAIFAIELVKPPKLATPNLPHPILPKPKK